MIVLISGIFSLLKNQSCSYSFERVMALDDHSQQNEAALGPKFITSKYVKLSHYFTSSSWIVSFSYLVLMSPKLSSSNHKMMAQNLVKVGPTSTTPVQKLSLLETTTLPGGYVWYPCGIRICLSDPYISWPIYVVIVKYTDHLILIIRTHNWSFSTKAIWIDCIMHTEWIRGYGWNTYKTSPV